MKKTSVLIVDDSAMIRNLFTEILNSDPDLEVIGTAEDPYDAREKIKALNPDVVTLDIEMPKMDGISFLKKIMSLRPMPVVMVSSLTQKGAKATIEALEIGAVDYVPKSGSKSFDVDVLKDDLISKVKIAARAKVRVYKEKVESLNIKVPSSGYKKNALIAMGSSTGGVEALKEIITVMPKNAPPIVIVQHMPATFTTTFAARLDQCSTINVHEAKNGMRIEVGNAYIAPGDQHMIVESSANGLICKLYDGDTVSGHKPSVDVLFASLAKLTKKDIVGVMLTGMGKDGAKSMLEMKKAGTYNIGQNEETCVVYGMPKAAYLAGALDKQVPLNKIAIEVLKQCV